jgi:hypothetical protein
LLISTQVTAYNVGQTEEVCKKPKFHSFSLPEYTAASKQEVPPESSFSFTTPTYIDPATLKVIVKNKVLPVEVVYKNSFYWVSGKIPAEYTGQFMRFQIHARALLGCKGLEGWLVKVAAK